MDIHYTYMSELNNFTNSPITKDDVLNARDELIALNQKPTIDKIRIKLGNRGSKTTIQKHLKSLEIEKPITIRDKSVLNDRILDLASALTQELKTNAEKILKEKESEFLKVLENKDLGMKSLSMEKESVIEKLNILEKKHNELCEKNLYLTQEISKNANEIQDLKASNKEKDAISNEKDKKIFSIEKMCDHFKTSMEHYRESSQELRGQEIEKHEQEIQKLANEIKNLKDEKQIFTTELLDVKNIVNKKVFENKHLESLNLELEIRLENSQNEIKNKKNELRQTQDLLKKEQNKSMKFELKISELSSNNTQLKSKIVLLKNNKDEKNEFENILKTINDKLRDK